MFHSLRSQFIVPVCVTILIAVFFVSTIAYFLSHQSARHITEQRLAAVAAVAVSATYPLTENVLEQMRGLSSMEIATVQKSDGVIVQKTIGIDAKVFTPIGLVKGSSSRAFVHDCSWISQRWDMLIRPIGVDTEMDQRWIVVMSRHENQESLVAHAIYLPIATGSVAAVAVGLIATFFATRIGNRIRRLGEHVSRIELGKSEPFVLVGPQDEIAILTEDVNRMTNQLKTSQQTLAANQRSQLINQFASGMAHQLRNTLTGARLAIQIHQQDRTGESSEDLEIAIEQLRVAEQSIQSLLQVRTGLEHSTSAPQSVELITSQLVSLVSSKAEHRNHQVRIQIDNDAKKMMLADGQSILGAVLNLALNGIEAMVEPGILEIAVTRLQTSENQALCRFSISDTGPGPSEAIEGTMMDAFCTTKLEGIGIGLPMALSVATRYGGSLSWKREEILTRFSFIVPVLSPSPRETQSL